MKTKSVASTVSLVLLLLLVVKVQVSSCYRFDYLVLAQQWPPTVCKFQSCTTTPIPRTFFTVHGVWPSNITVSPTPSRCPSTTDFTSKTLVQNLQPDIDTFWPNLLGPNEIFWKHEWDDHGRCSEDKFNLNGYFTLALKLRKKADIIASLSKMNIFPSPTERYDLNQISKAIQAGLGANVAINFQCKDDTPNKLSYLKEVQICLDPTGNNYIPCPRRGPQNNC